MHSVSEQQMGVNNVPAFLTKLWTLVEDSTTDDMITWDPSGVSFHIYDQARFAKEILPLYFKHSNIASFIRQLNMYGFRKVIHMESGAIKSEWDDVEFHHPYFIRGEESLLGLIKRKQSNTPSIKPEAGVKLNPEDINRVLTDVQVMREKQDNFTTKIDSMKRENEALWREVASLRQKHLKQQQIVNKLIEFMIHLVGGKKGLKTGIPLKRKMPLMIGDSQPVATPKRQRYAKAFSIEDSPQSYVVNSPAPSSAKDTCSSVSSGPEIHDVTDMFLAASKPSTTSRSPSATVFAPDSSIVRATPSTSAIQPLTSGSGQKSKLDNSTDALDVSLDSNDLSALVDSSLLQTLEPLTSNGDENTMDRFNRLTKDGSVSTLSLPSSMTNQLDTMQDQLDDLKGLLTGSQYNFDPTTILGLFNNDTSIPTVPTHLELPTELKEEETSGHTDPNTIIGNELVSFPLDNSLPNIYPDLSDLITPDLSDLSVPTSTEDDHYGHITVDPLSFDSMQGTSKSKTTSSQGTSKKKS